MMLGATEKEQELGNTQGSCQIYSLGMAVDEGLEPDNPSSNWGAMLFYRQPTVPV